MIHQDNQGGELEISSKPRKFGIVFLCWSLVVVAANLGLSIQLETEKAAVGAGFDFALLALKTFFIPASIVLISLVWRRFRNLKSIVKIFVWTSVPLLVLTFFSFFSLGVNAQ